MFDTFSFVSGANRTGMGEMGVLASHGLVIRRDIFFFSIKHWLRHLSWTDGRIEGNGRHSKKRSSRIWKIWLTMHCLLLFLSFNKVVGGTILQSSKIDWLQPPLHPTPGNKENWRFFGSICKELLCSKSETNENSHSRWKLSLRPKEKVLVLAQDWEKEILFLISKAKIGFSLNTGSSIYCIFVPPRQS